jgi:hypothetical protein
MVVLILLAKFISTRIRAKSKSCLSISQKSYLYLAMVLVWIVGAIVAYNFAIIVTDGIYKHWQQIAISVLVGLGYGVISLIEFFIIIAPIKKNYTFLLIVLNYSLLIFISLQALEEIILLSTLPLALIIAIFYPGEIKEYNHIKWRKK